MKWTPKMRLYIKENVGKMPIEKIVEELGIPKNAIYKEHSRIKNKDIDYSYRVSYVARSLGVCLNTVKNWIDKGYLKAERRVTGISERWFIKPDDIWEFIMSRRHLYNMSHYMLGTLVPEPDWVINERKRCE